MDLNVRLPGGGWDTFDTGSLVGLSKRPDIDPEDPPTQVTLVDGVILTDDSMRTVMARIGDAVPMTDLDVPGSRWPDAVALARITHMTKAFEDRSGDDPTLVHLSNGEVLSANESIRTLEARLKLDAGLTCVALDLPGTDRPACLVADHVLAHGPMGGRHPYGKTGGTRSYVILAGAWSLECADHPDRLALLIEEGRTPAPGGAAPAA